MIQKMIVGECYTTFYIPVYYRIDCVHCGDHLDDTLKTLSLSLPTGQLNEYSIHQVDAYELVIRQNDVVVIELPLQLQNDRTMLLDYPHGISELVLPTNTTTNTSGDRCYVIIDDGIYDYGCGCDTADNVGDEYQYHQITCYDVNIDNPVRYNTKTNTISHSNIHIHISDTVHRDWDGDYFIASDDDTSHKGNPYSEVRYE